MKYSSGSKSRWVPNSPSHHSSTLLLAVRAWHTHTTLLFRAFSLPNVWNEIVKLIAVPFSSTNDSWLICDNMICKVEIRHYIPQTGNIHYLPIAKWISRDNSSNSTYSLLSIALLNHVVDSLPLLKIEIRFSYPFIYILPHHLLVWNQELAPVFQSERFILSHRL